MPRPHSAHTGPPSSHTSMSCGHKTNVGRARHPITAGSARASQAVALLHVAEEA